MNETSPRVFISYSWETEDHRAWVRMVAEQLVHYGVNVRLDQWHLAPGHSFTRFMEHELRAADFCIVVCTPNYAEKANNRRGGVGYEQQIISGDMMSGIERSKFIPILRSGEYVAGPQQAIPTHFSGIALIDFRAGKMFNERFEELLRVIYAKPKYIPPERGRIFPLPSEPHSTPVFTKQPVQQSISIHILDWYHLDVMQFTRDVFDLTDFAGLDQDVIVEICAPDLNSLIACIRGQSDRKNDVKIVTEQRSAVQGAYNALNDMKRVTAHLLRNVSEHYGIRVAIPCVSRYLELTMALTVHRLGSYQIRDGAIFEDFVNWFEYETTAEIAQFVYSKQAMAEIIIGSKPYPSKSDEYTKVFVPLGCIENSGMGELFAYVWESCEYIRNNIWIDYVIPQMAFEQTQNPSSYLVWTRESSVYCTEGHVWRGNTVDDERVVPRE